MVLQESYLTTCSKLIQPVFEMATVTAAMYCKATGRSVVTSKDMEYGLKFSTRKVLGNQTESLFPEIYEETNSETESDEDEAEDDEEPFVRYEGTDETLRCVNEMYDTWDEWEPDTPIGQMLKNAISSRC